MKTTVADLMGRRQVDTVQGLGASAQRTMTEIDKPNAEIVYTVRLLVNPEECEILDGKIMIEKRVVGRTHRDAVERFGLQVSAF